MKIQSSMNVLTPLRDQLNSKYLISFFSFSLTRDKFSFQSYSPISSIFFSTNVLRQFFNFHRFKINRFRARAQKKKKKNMLLLLFFWFVFHFPFIFTVSKQTIFFLNNRDIKLPNIQKMNQWNVPCFRLNVNFFQSTLSETRKAREEIWKRYFPTSKREREKKRKLKNLLSMKIFHSQFVPTFNSRVF